MNTPLADNSNSRLSFVDLFRACGIILMVMGHIYFGMRFDHYIHAFHMPMFFFCSGFFYKPCNSKADAINRIGRKAKTLLLPYCSFALLHFVIISLAEKRFCREAVYLFFWNTEQAGFPISGALWFLTALFLTETFYILLDRLLNSGSLLTAASLGLAVLATFMASYVPLRLPLGMNAAFVGLGFFHLARLLRQSHAPFFISLLHLNLTISICMFIVSAVLVFLNGPVNMRTGSYAMIPLFWLNAFLAILSLWNLCRFGDSLLSRIPRCYKYILRIGKDSIVYLGLNQLVIRAITPLITAFQLPFLLQQIVILILTLVVLELVRNLITGTKLSVLIGK